MFTLTSYPYVIRVKQLPRVGDFLVVWLDDEENVVDEAVKTYNFSDGYGEYVLHRVDEDMMKDASGFTRRVWMISED